MAKSTATTVNDYMNELTDDRRDTISSVRQIILNNLPKGYEETMQYGMISYVIPLETFPKTYNKQPLAYISLAAQKNYTSIYLMGVYGDQDTERWFVEGYKASGKKLNMGKSCVRFKKLDDLPLDLIGKAVASTTPDQFIELYKAAVS